MKIKFQTFDAINEMVCGLLFQLDDWYPSMEDIEPIMQGKIDLEKIAFFLWVLNSPLELTDYEKKVKKNIQLYLYDNLEIVDEEEEI